MSQRLGRSRSRCWRASGGSGASRSLRRGMPPERQKEPRPAGGRHDLPASDGFGAASRSHRRHRAAWSSARRASDRWRQLQPLLRPSHPRGLSRWRRRSGRTRSPAAAALHELAPAKVDEAFRPWFAADDLEGDMGLVLHSGDLPAGVAAVGEDALHEGEARPGSLQDVNCTVAVLDIGATDFDREQPAVDVSQDMSLRAAILAPRTGDLSRMIERGFERIGVGNEPVSSATAAPSRRA